MRLQEAEYRCVQEEAEVDESAERDIASVERSDFDASVNS